MDATRALRLLADRLGPRLVGWAFEKGQKIPLLRQRIEAHYDALLDQAATGLRPYANEVADHRQLPARGLERDAVLGTVRLLLGRETERWSSGQVSGAVYHGDPEHIEFLNRVYALASQANPLHFDVWPSISKFEAEIVSMTARMLGASDGDAYEETKVYGVVSSGGTESILLAMKAYRDRARAEASIDPVEIIAPDSAHAAFDKAADTLGMRLVRVPLGPGYRADADAMQRAISARTAVLVASAPSFPHGVIDPIERLSEIALERNLGLHVDACLGGFVLPWAEKLGYPVPRFDFRLAGVSSMSADTHKYGYAAKGTSVVLYRGKRLRRYQYFVATDWPGGLYFSPTFAGSRPGALSAACWAALVSTGEQGYLEATRKILETAARIRAGIEKIPELLVLGDPLWVIAFSARSFDVYRLLDAMSQRGWSLNGLQRPASIHLAVTLRHTPPGVADRFLEDLRTSVNEVKSSPASKGGMAPVYGMAGSFPVRGAIAELLRRYLDRLYEV
jgi:sphinganine-1-phosphate aldolase